MNTKTKIRRRDLIGRPLRRSGFTLVELLVVIAIIGILIGMVATAVFPALIRAKEYTIQNEMKQIEGAIEQFKTKYHLYPPSFARITNKGTNSSTQSVAALLPYINLIAPNNREGLGAVGSRPIDLWWTKVGSKIHYADGDDLVFWLSGLFENKQYPLTNGAAAANMPNAYNDGVGSRDALFEFKSSQLAFDSPATQGPTAHYMQASGPQVPYVYIDANSYTAGTPYKANPTTYINPKTFQLIAFGMDGLAGNFGLVTSAGAQGMDNIVNFADGRLDKYIKQNTN